MHSVGRCIDADRESCRYLKVGGISRCLKLRIVMCLKLGGTCNQEASQGVSSSALSCVSKLEVPAIRRYLKVSQAPHTLIIGRG